MDGHILGTESLPLKHIKNDYDPKTDFLKKPPRVQVLGSKKLLLERLSGFNNLTNLAKIFSPGPIMFLVESEYFYLPQNKDTRDYINNFGGLISSQLIINQELNIFNTRDGESTASGLLPTIVEELPVNRVRVINPGLVTFTAIKKILRPSTLLTKEYQTFFKPDKMYGYGYSTKSFTPSSNPEIILGSMESLREMFDLPPQSYFKIQNLDNNKLLYNLGSQTNPKNFVRSLNKAFIKMKKLGAIQVSILEPKLGKNSWLEIFNCQIRNLSNLLDIEVNFALSAKDLLFE